MRYFITLLSLTLSLLASTNTQKISDLNDSILIYQRTYPVDNYLTKDLLRQIEELDKVKDDSDIEANYYIGLAYLQLIPSYNSNSISFDQSLAYKKIGIEYLTKYVNRNKKALNYKNALATIRHEKNMLVKIKKEMDRTKKLIAEQNEEQRKSELEYKKKHHIHY